MMELLIKQSHAVKIGLDKQDADGDKSAETIFAEEFVSPANSFPDPENTSAPSYEENVYYFDYGNTRFIAFNTNYWWCNYPEDFGGNLEGYVMDNQLDWIRNVLDDTKSNPSIEHVFMFAHEPAFPNGGHLHDAQRYNGGDSAENEDYVGNPLDRTYVVERRDELWEAISQNGKVVAVFFGDEHNYNRMCVDCETPVHLDGSANANFTNSVWQIVSGGAGAPFFAQQQEMPWSKSVECFYPGKNYCMVYVNEEEVRLKVVSDSGEVIDQCVLREGIPPAKTIYVPSPGNETIQQAINNATASDTVFVWNGIYFENVILNKSITLQGEGKDVVTIDGSGNTCINVTAARTTIEDFDVTNATNADNCGILVSGRGYVDTCNIINNKITNNNAGICANPSNSISSISITISENTISNNVDEGIDDIVNNTGSVTISENRIYNNADEGIEGIEDSNGPVTISENRIYNNGDDGIDSVEDINGAVTITKNTISNNGDDGIAGIHDISGTVTVTDNTIVNNCGRGIGISTDNAMISDNEISENERGIWVSSSNNHVLRNMIVINSDTGVHLTDNANNNEIHKNCFYDNMLQAMDNGTGNDWDSNYWSPPPGGPGNYSIPPTFISKDHSPLTDCPL